MTIITIKFEFYFHLERESFMQGRFELILIYNSLQIYDALRGNIQKIVLNLPLIYISSEGGDEGGK